MTLVRNGRELARLAELGTPYLLGVSFAAIRVQMGLGDCEKDHEVEDRSESVLYKRADREACLVSIPPDIQHGRDIVL